MCQSLTSRILSKMPKTVEVGPIFNNGEAHAKVHSWINARPDYTGWRWEGEWYVRLRPPGSNRDALHRRAVKVVRERHEFRQAPRAHPMRQPRVGRRRRWPDLQQRRGGDEGVGVARRPSRICGLDVLRRMVPPLRSGRDEPKSRRRCGRGEPRSRRRCGWADPSSRRRCVRGEPRSRRRCGKM